MRMVLPSDYNPSVAYSHARAAGSGSGLPRCRPRDARSPGGVGVRTSFSHLPAANARAVGPSRMRAEIGARGAPRQEHFGAPGGYDAVDPLADDRKSVRH